jgi:hypothetical protein
MTSPPQSQMLLYQTVDGATRLEVRLEDETVWLTQNQMAELFQTSVPSVSRMHVRNVFSEGELQRAATLEEFSTVRSSKGTAMFRARFEHNDLQRPGFPCLADLKSDPQCGPWPIR